MKPGHLSQNKNITDNILLLLFILLLIVFSTFKVFQDDDIFWHLATGRYIVENKSIPSTDIFSYIESDTKWIPFEWGWDVATFAIYNLGGYVALSLFRTLLIIATFGLLLMTMKKLELSTGLIYSSLLLVAIALLPRMSIRPHLFSYLGYAFLIYIITVVRTDENKFRLLYSIPFIFLVWANVHMSVMLSLVVVVLFAVFYYRKEKNNKTPNQNKIKTILIILIATAIAMIVNPHHINTYIYAYEHSSMDMLQNINEWRSPFASDRGIYNIIYFLFLALSVYSVYKLLKKRDYFPALVIVLTAANSFRAVRFTAEFLLLSVVFIVIAYEPIFRKVFSEKQLGIINGGLTIIIVLLLYFSYTNELYSKVIKSNFRETGFGINEKFFPVKMFDFIRKTRIEQIGSNPFNSLNIGGYFIWNFPERKNFIDSRNISEKRYNLYKELNAVRSGFDARLKQLGIDYILYSAPTMTLNASVLEKTIIAYLSTSPEWKLLYWDDISFLFVKNETKFANLIKQYEYKYLNPYKYIFQSKDFIESYNNDKDGFMQEVIRKQSEDFQSKILRDIVKRLNIEVKIN
ncbi:MAG: hypothetical protein ACP5P3_07780 [Ignavibacteria bacterium]